MYLNNIAIIWTPKWKDPNNEDWSNHYFVPAQNDQLGECYNYIIVCCSPEFNGVYRYPAANRFDYSKWNNNGRVCLYVPIADCTKIKELQDITADNLVQLIKKEQRKYLKYKRQTNPEYKKPKWFI